MQCAMGGYELRSPLRVSGVADHFCVTFEKVVIACGQQYLCVTIVYHSLMLYWNIQCGLSVRIGRNTLCVCGEHACGCVCACPEWLANFFALN